VEIFRFVFVRTSGEQAIQPAMRVQLIRKLAERADGVDLSAYREGDTLELPSHDAKVLIAEQWAIPAENRIARETRQYSFTLPLAEAADMVRSRIVESLRRVAQQLQQHEFDAQPHRRAEDRVRDDLHEERARISTANRNVRDELVSVEAPTDREPPNKTPAKRQAKRKGRAATGRPR
jgi:hypothetical protein